MTAALAFAAGALGVLGLVALVPKRPGRGATAFRLLIAPGHALRRRLGARAPASLEAKLAAAALNGRLSPRDLMAAKLATALIGTCAGLLLAASAPGRLGLV